MPKIHSFQIPVMGTGFSIDTPIKVAKYGISSVISLVDDNLIEEMRKYYCELIGQKYTPITKRDEDYRASRITAYLNLVDLIVKNDFEKLKNSEFNPDSEITKYFELLSDNSPLKLQYNEMIGESDSSRKKQMQEKLRDQIMAGSINVNIMTKLDRTNYDQNSQELPGEYSDALSALRGYALSTLNSAIVFSAGFNRKLYSYVEKFEDFYANTKGLIKKKIILKVSDYRSSIVQGRFFAKKGLWVSEYRVESGLNCGGHAFASQGFLLGPILDEFKKKKNELVSKISKIYNDALCLKNREPFSSPHEMRITAQGGIGTSKEDKFLQDYYQVDQTGWATPFLLVPEATSVDEVTLDKLAQAKEADLYCSDVSPLGVKFNNLQDSPSEIKKHQRIEEGSPGSPCPKGHLVSNTEFTEKPICTASRAYQKQKIAQLQSLNLDSEIYQQELKKVTEKACICHDLGQGARLMHKITELKNSFTAVCPGPNLAYFSRIATLKEMVEHIYGRINLIDSEDRPNLFISELRMYIEHFVEQVKECTTPTEKQIQYFVEFKDNLLEGIEYYKELFPKMIAETQEFRQKAMDDLQLFKKNLETFISEQTEVFAPTT